MAKNEIEKFTRVLETTNGRDKVTKALQYGSKILCYYYSSFLDGNTTVELKKTLTETLNNWNHFDEAVGNGRKVMRFFTFLNGYLALMEAINTGKKGSLILWLDSISKMSLGMYGFYDNLSFLSKLIGSNDKKASSFLSMSCILNKNRVEEYNLRGNHFWILGIAFGLVSSVQKLLETIEQEKTASEKEPFEKKRKQLTLQVFALILDLFTALSLAKYVDFNKGVQGLLGLVSAGIGIYNIW